jgi:hypothetical protein
MGLARPVTSRRRCSSTTRTSGTEEKRAAIASALRLLASVKEGKNGEQNATGTQGVHLGVNQGFEGAVSYVSSGIPDSNRRPPSLGNLRFSQRTR